MRFDGTLVNSKMCANTNRRKAVWYVSKTKRYEIASVEIKVQK